MVAVNAQLRSIEWPSRKAVVLLVLSMLKEQVFAKRGSALNAWMENGRTQENPVHAASPEKAGKSGNTNSPQTF